MRPAAEPRTMERFTQYTRSWERPNATDVDVEFCEWSGVHEPPSHSIPPAVGGKVAESFGAEPWHRFHLALMRAYFTDNRTISELAVMRSVAEEEGIDGDSFEQRYHEGGEHHTAQVIDEHNSSIELGVTGVPCVVINDTFPVMGAQELDFYRRMIDNILAREQE